MTANAPLVHMNLVQAVNGNSDSHSCLCERSLTPGLQLALEHCGMIVVDMVFKRHVGELMNNGIVAFLSSPWVFFN